MMKDFKRVFVAESDDLLWRAELKKVLKTWIRCMDQFSTDEQLSGNYLPFWYNERAHVSFLAGAVWRSSRQAFAVEEFRTRKGKGETRHVGRGDLLMKLGDTLVCAECKAVRPNIETSNPGPWDIARRQMLKARSEVRGVNLRKVKHSARVGICFLAPKIPTARAKNFTQLREQFISWIKTQRREDPLALVKPTKRKKADFWAAYFPEYAASAKIVGWERHRWPGVVLLGTTIGFGAE